MTWFSAESVIKFRPAIPLFWVMHSIWRVVDYKLPQSLLNIIPDVAHINWHALSGASFCILFTEIIQQIFMMHFEGEMHIFILYSQICTFIFDLYRGSINLARKCKRIESEKKSWKISLSGIRRKKKLMMKHFVKKFPLLFLWLNILSRNAHAELNANSGRSGYIWVRDEARNKQFNIF
jgi:hypothetical protein